MSVKRYRIRPPGCKDESKYQWRTVREQSDKVATNGIANGSNGHKESVPVKEESPKKESTPTSITWEQSLQDTKKSLISKITDSRQLKIEGRTYKGSSGQRTPGGFPCYVTRRWKDKRTAEQILSLIDLGDTEDELIKREVQFPFYSFPVKYNLQMRKEGTAVEYLTPQYDSEDLKNIYLHLLVEIVTNDKGEVTAELIMTQSLPLDIKGTDDWHARKSFEAAASLLHRLSKNIKFTDPGLGKNVVGFVKQFSESCNSSDFVEWKNYDVEGIGEVPILRRPELEGTNYAAFRAEAELDGTPSDFAALMESMGLGGHVRKTMTPECEAQEYLDEDGPLKLVRKTDKIAPWPLSKREFVFTSVTCWDTDGTLYICQKSYEDPKIQVKSDSCRAIFHEVGFRCVPIGPNKMKVMQLVHADPIGLPKSAVEAKMTDRAKVLGKIKVLFTQRDKWLK
eukprot:TRINITY_DN1082_c0_g1_i1.p1 TRINITY_DN1082_c0_g1~~TRINITY_DN1082_c0_g1_i1.p1  ORF type:complete len:452 (+),score=94.37 TRINITY_DN1082_c0_g1_i1:49-1404(+)